MTKTLLNSQPIADFVFKNRIFAAVPQSMLATADGLVSGDLLDYYGKLAQSGAAAVIVEGTTVSDKCRSWHRQLDITTTESLSGLTALAEKLQFNGAQPLIQLMHSGINSLPDKLRQVYGPSAITHPAINARIAELSLPQIDSIISQFAQAAIMAVNAGFAGVEINGAESGLIHQFLSPLTNKRTDAYGIQNDYGMLFPAKIIAKIKKAAPNKLLILKLSLKDLVPGGANLNNSINLARLIQPSGVDAFHLTEGFWHGSAHSFRMLTRDSVDAPFADDALQFKSQIEVPVILSGKIGRPDVAERAITKGCTDFVSLGRTINRNPDWIKKARIDSSSISYRDCLRCIVCTSATSGCPDMKGFNLWKSTNL